MTEASDFGVARDPVQKNVCSSIFKEKTGDKKTGETPNRRFSESGTQPSCEATKLRS